jgi:hypothetical protein
MESHCVGKMQFLKRYIKWYKLLLLWFRCLISQYWLDCETVVVKAKETLIFVICISLVILQVNKWTEELFPVGSDGMSDRKLPMFQRNTLHWTERQHVCLKHQCIIIIIVVVVVSCHILSSWYFPWTSGAPHHSHFKFHTAVLSVLCVISQV